MVQKLRQVSYDFQYIFSCETSYFDGFNTPHWFTAGYVEPYTGFWGCALYDGINGIDYPQIGSISPDGAGYTFNADLCQWSGPTCVIAYDGGGVPLAVEGLNSVDGNSIVPQGVFPLGPGVTAGSVIDRNGNEVSVNSSGTFTDTLGTTALTQTDGAPSPFVYQYTDSNGNPTDVTVTYTSYTVRTNFGCGGISEFGPTSVYLIDRGTVKFNGTTGSPTSWGFTSIAVPVPSGATTGNVVVTVSGMPSNSVAFTVTGGLSGTVTRQSDGTAISGATVQVLQNRVVMATTTTASNGGYSVSNLGTGEYDVKFSASGFGTVLQAAVSVPASGSTLNQALPAYGTISGQITQSNGVTAISGATVSVLQSSETVATATSDGSGNYSIATLSAGSYEVDASAAGYVNQGQTGVSVSSGSTTPANFSLNVVGARSVPKALKQRLQRRVYRIIVAEIIRDLLPQIFRHIASSSDGDEQKFFFLSDVEFTAQAVCGDDFARLQLVAEDEYGNPRMRDHLLPIKLPLFLSIRALGKRAQNELVVQSFALMLVKLDLSTFSYDSLDKTVLS